MSRLTRGSSVERVVSPDQLDQTIRVTGTLYWTALAGVLLALVSAAVWSLTGSIPTKAMGEGLVIRPGGVYNVYAAGAGFVKRFDVRVGERVKAGQAVAEIDQPSSRDDIEASEQHLDEVRDQAEESIVLRQDTAKLQEQSLAVQRASAERDLKQQTELEKIASDEVTTAKGLYSKGLLTRQVVVDAQQRLIAIQSSIGQLQAQIAQADAQSFQAGWEPKELEKQSEIQIHDLEAQLKSLRAHSQLTSIVLSPASGQVIEEKTYPGALVAAGAPIMSIEPDGGEMTAVLYVPSAQAKEVKVGMEAEISPSTAPREEYGFIRGKVKFVSDYPATGSGMMALLENDALVASLRGRGMVTEVDVTMERDAATPSRFRWSSSHGPETEITPGTLCSAQIITRSQKPIALVLPFLKHITGLD